MLNLVNWNACAEAETPPGNKGAIGILEALVLVWSVGSDHGVESDRKSMFSMTKLCKTLQTVLMLPRLLLSQPRDHTHNRGEALLMILLPVLNFMGLICA